MEPVRVDAVVVGAGPAGLATAACLRREGLDPVVLERGDRAGLSWTRHYERLHLHTPRQTSALPYHPWPAGTPTYPSREQVVAYLEGYAAAHGIAPRFGQDVQRVWRDGDWHVRTASTEYVTAHVVVATGYNGAPVRPDVPGLDGFDGVVVHTRDYRSGSAFAGQRVLVVGCGNSGSEIAVDLHEQGARPAIVVRGPVHVVPRDVFGVFPIARSAIAMRRLSARTADALTLPLLRVVIGDLSAYGIVRPAEGPRTLLERTGRVPIIDIGLIGLIRAGQVDVRPGVVSVRGREVTFADGRSEPFDALVLATGYRPDADRVVEADVFDERGRPRAYGEAVAPGLYFVGFHNAITGLLREIGIEARRVARAIAA